MRTLQPRGMRILLSGLSLGLFLGASTASRAQTTFGSGFTLNTNTAGVPTLSGGTLTLTNGTGGEASSAFSNSTVSVSAPWLASFTYTASAGADGATFALEEAGPTALGAPGGGLGYMGITNSAAIDLNIYGGYTIGTAYSTGGNIPATYNPTSNLSLTGAPVTVNLAYDGTTLTEYIKNTTSNVSYAATYTTNLTSVLGASTAYIGFTGGTGGVTSTQTISNFSFTNTSSYAVANPLSVTGFNVAGISNGTGTTSGGINGNSLDGQFVYYAKGFNTSTQAQSGGTLSNANTGLPVGTTFTSAATNAFTNTTVKFAIAPVTTSATPNLLLDYAGSTSNTLTLATPGKFTGLSFLNTGFNGNQGVTYTLNYATGTPVTGTFTAGDNYNYTGANTAISANGRVQVSNGAFGSVNSGDPELYEADITGVDANRVLNSITFTDAALTGSSSFGIFGVSGVSAITSAATPEPGSVALLASALLPIGGLALRRRRKV